MSRRITQRILSAVTVGLLSTSLVACSEDSTSTDTVKIGWQVPLTGIYETLGAEMDKAFKLYLETHDNKLGGRNVELVEADEGEDPDAAKTEAEKMILKDEIVALSGVLNSGVYNAIAPITQENGVPFVGSGGRPNLEAEMENLDGLWHTSWVNEQPGEAIAPYILEEVDGPVYAIGPDYAGGHANVGGFTAAFDKLGGKLANEGGETEWTPFPDTTDFTPYFNEIAQSDAKAVYTFYAGKAAVDFVTQYAESDIKDIPLYSNFLTEGSVLTGQGDAAEGIISSMAYAVNLDNDANRDFVSSWGTVSEESPSIFAVSAWDSALVLDMAIGSIAEGETVTSENLGEAIEKLGEIKSPRGNWQFGPVSHAPIQRYYLREVREDGGSLSNQVIEDLATLGE